MVVAVEAGCWWVVGDGLCGEGWWLVCGRLRSGVVDKVEMRG